MRHNAIGLLSSGLIISAMLTSAPATLAGVVGAPIRAAPLPDFDFEWAVIGDPGNRPTMGDENPRDPIRANIGAVPYVYRMAKTEVTVGQWLEFLSAYAPFWANSPNHDAVNATDLMGIFIGLNNDPGESGVPEWVTFPEWLNRPALGISWRNAARYVNWLHNGKAIAASAFEQGVYDTTTFTEFFDPVLNTFIQNDQHKHDPDARFWIPTIDEWAKAVFWDPNRFGAGQGGYWLFPDSSDTELVSGFPGEPGAQTSAGLFGSVFEVTPDVGAYPDVMTPWGLLDASGGAAEWLETQHIPNVPGLGRLHAGSGVGLEPFVDRLNGNPFNLGGGILSGLRIASAIPTPGSAFTLTCGLLLSLRRTRR